MRAATLEGRLEELGVLKSFSRSQVSNDTPYSESLFRTVKCRLDYPRKTFGWKEKACQWVAGFVEWYDNRHRHSGIKLVTPFQQHSGSTNAICKQRTNIDEKARRTNPTPWKRHTRCWHHLEEVWINKRIEEPNPIQSNPIQALTSIQAASVAAEE